jgi:hypothetical protein
MGGATQQRIGSNSETRTRSNSGTILNYDQAPALVGLSTEAATNARGGAWSVERDYDGYHAIASVWPNIRTKVRVIVFAALAGSPFTRMLFPEMASWMLLVA